jgi:hypothetical protein
VHEALDKARATLRTPRLSLTPTVTAGARSSAVGAIVTAIVVGCEGEGVGAWGVCRGGTGRFVFVFRGRGCSAEDGSVSHDHCCFT